jgi:hypothetical protein
MDELKNKLNFYIESLKEYPSKEDYIKNITNIYNELNKKTRKPTEYNLFFKEEMLKLKDSDLKPKEKMVIISDKWFEKKQEGLQKGKCPRNFFNKRTKNTTRP